MDILYIYSFWSEDVQGVRTITQHILTALKRFNLYAQYR